MATTETNPRYARDLERNTTNTTAWGWALAIIAVLLIAGAGYYYMHYTVAGNNPYVGTSDTNAPAMSAAPTDTGASSTMSTAPEATTPAPSTTAPVTTTSPAANQ